MSILTDNEGVPILLFPLLPEMTQCTRSPRVLLLRAVIDRVVEEGHFFLSFLSFFLSCIVSSSSDGKGEGGGTDPLEMDERIPLFGVVREPNKKKSPQGSLTHIHTNERTVCVCVCIYIWTWTRQCNNKPFSSSFYFCTWCPFFFFFFFFLSCCCCRESFG